MPSGDAARPVRRAQAGFGYVWVLLAVAIFGIGLGAVGEIWSTQKRRDCEEELLRVGREFRAALHSYHLNSKIGTPAFPTHLEELLEDRRGPVLRRHLRKIYADPMTASQDWGLVRAPDGRIRGVYSRWNGKPLKTANFDPKDSAFEQAETYADWRFEYVPPRIAAPQRR